MFNSSTLVVAIVVGMVLGAAVEYHRKATAPFTISGTEPVIFTRMHSWSKDSGDE